MLSYCLYCIIAFLWLSLRILLKIDLCFKFELVCLLSLSGCQCWTRILQTLNNHWWFETLITVYDIWLWKQLCFRYNKWIITPLWFINYVRTRPNTFPRSQEISAWNSDVTCKLLKPYKHFFVNSLRILFLVFLTITHVCCRQRRERYENIFFVIDDLNHKYYSFFFVLISWNFHACQITFFRAYQNLIKFSWPMN